METVTFHMVANTMRDTLRLQTTELLTQNGNKRHVGHAVITSFLLRAATLIMWDMLLLKGFLHRTRHATRRGGVSGRRERAA